MPQPQPTAHAPASESRAETKSQGDLAGPAATLPSKVGQRAQIAPSLLSTTDVLALQRSIGNRETARLLAPSRPTKPRSAREEQPSLATPADTPPLIQQHAPSGEASIQRVWGKPVGSDTKVNLETLTGKKHDGQQLYIDNQTGQKYVRVANLSRPGALVVKRVPTRASKTQKGGARQEKRKAETQLDKAKRKEKREKDVLQKRHDALKKRRKQGGDMTVEGPEFTQEQQHFHPQIKSPEYMGFLNQYGQDSGLSISQLQEQMLAHHDSDIANDEEFDDDGGMTYNEMRAAQGSVVDGENVPAFLPDLFTVYVSKEEAKKHDKIKGREKVDGKVAVSSARNPIVVMISFNLEKYGNSTVTKTASIAEIVRDAVAQIMEVYHPTILAFQEVTNADIFIDGLQGKASGIGKMDLMHQYFEGHQKSYSRWQNHIDTTYGEGVSSTISQNFQMQNMFGIDKGPSFKSVNGGNPERYPILFDQGKVLETPEYYIWKKNQLVQAPSDIMINLSPEEGQDQTPRPVVYAKIKISTSPWGLRPGDSRDDKPLTLYAGIVHTSPSMKAFSSYVSDIGIEYKKVKAYTEKQGATAVLLGDVYAEKSAKTFLKDIQKDKSLRAALPEYKSNMTLSNKTNQVTLNQRADMAVVPQHMGMLDRARNIPGPNQMPFSLDEHYRQQQQRDKETNPRKKSQMDTNFESSIKEWRDINIDHTPVMLPVEVFIDAEGNIEKIAKKEA